MQYLFFKHAQCTALTIKNFSQKNLPFYVEISDNIITHKLFFRGIDIKKGGFFMKTKLKVTRKETRRHFEQFHLAVELAKVVKHFFPDLVCLLKQKIPETRVTLPIQMSYFS